MNNNFYLNILTADNLGVGLFKYALKPQERFIIVNSACAKILGSSSKIELKNKKLDELFLNKEDKRQLFSLLKKKGKAKFFEAQLKNKSGEFVWVAITASLVASKSSEYIEGIIEDISLRKHMEAKLSLERDFMQGLLDNIPDAVYFKDRKNRIIKVNNFYAQGFNLKAAQILGKTDFDFFPREQAQKMFEDDNYVLNSGKPIVGKIERTLLPNGTWNQVITTKIPMYDSNGKIIGTMGITRDMTVYANLEKERKDMLTNALTALGKALEMRDPYTFSHNHKVAEIAEKIGAKLGWDENRLLNLKLAGELHDLGKITIPLDILNKPGKLTATEYHLVQEHVTKSYDIIKEIKFPFSLAEMIYQHHERLNGTGYPRGLKEGEICPESRILAVSDVLESMTSRRPYRESLGIEKALDELKQGSGTLYDAPIVSTVFSLVAQNKNSTFWQAN